MGLDFRYNCYNTVVDSNYMFEVTHDASVNVLLFIAADSSLRLGCA